MLGLVCAWLGAAIAGAAPSSWVYFGTNGLLAYKTWGNGNRIMDFSHAGYMGGGVALPAVGTVQTLNPSGGDDRAALQAAINAVASRPPVNGFRGALELGPGVFLVSGQVNINASGVVVRGSGSGSGGTVIRMTAATPMTLFNIAGSGSPSEGSPVNITNTYVPSGATSFNVSAASGFSVGDSVIIHRPVTTNWIAYLGMDQLVRDGATQTWLTAGSTITTDRKIRQVSGTRITLDVPLTDSFDSAFPGNPVGTIAKYTWSGRISQAALEHLRIEAPPAADAYVSVTMDNLIDCWVRDVVIQDGVNCFTLTKDTKRVTVDEVIITHTVPSTASAGPSDFACTGTQIFLNKCRTYGTGSWPLVTHTTGTGPIVALNFFSTQLAGISPHQRWCTGVLADNCSLPNAPSGTQGIAYRNRGTMGSGQGWTTGWSVAWNVTTPYFLVCAAPGTENWCIGGIGAKTSNADPDGVYESPGSKADLGETGSLYLEQLRERLGDQALANIGYLPSPIDPATPADQELVVGSNVVFEVVPRTNVTILSYQWFEATLSGDVAIGSNSAFLTIPGAQDSDAGRQFYCRVTSNLGPFNSRTARIRDSGLIAHIPFDDGTADDFSGHGNHGALVNGASVAADPERGGVLSLDGTTGYVDLGNDASLDLAGGGTATIAAWVKVLVSHNHNAILSKGEWKAAYSLLIKGDTTPKDQLWTGNDTSVFSVNPVPLGTWTHVAVAINGALTTFYLNGQASGPADQNRGNPIDSTTNSVCIGREQYAGSLPAGRWFFNGLMDDVRLYNRALTQAEIRSIAVSTAPPIVAAVAREGANLVLSWTGGVAPYQVRARTNLSEAWQTYGGALSTNRLALTPTHAAEFYQIQSQ